MGNIAITPSSGISIGALPTFSITYNHNKTRVTANLSIPTTDGETKKYEFVLDTDSHHILSAQKKTPQFSISLDQITFPLSERKLLVRMSANLPLPDAEKESLEDFLLSFDKPSHYISRDFLHSDFSLNEGVVYDDKKNQVTVFLGTNAGYIARFYIDLNAKTGFMIEGLSKIPLENLSKEYGQDLLYVIQHSNLPKALTQKLGEIGKQYWDFPLNKPINKRPTPDYQALIPYVKPSIEMDYEDSVPFDEKSRTALLIIDMQSRFIDPAKFQEKISAIRNLIQANNGKRPIIFVEYRDLSGARSEDPTLSALTDFLPYTPDQEENVKSDHLYHIGKTFPNVFFGSDSAQTLLDIIDRYKLTHVVVTGTSQDTCVRESIDGLLAETSLSVVTSHDLVMNGNTPYNPPSSEPLSDYYFYTPRIQVLADSPSIQQILATQPNLE